MIKESIKKIKILLASLIVAGCLTGCGDNSSEHITNYDTDDTNGLVVLCSHELGQSTTITFIRDTYTDNVYIKCFEEHGYGKNYSSSASLSPYYNTEGKIMSYTEFTQVHKH